MALPLDGSTQFFATVFREIDSALVNFVNDTSTRLISEVAIWATVLFTLAVMLHGIRMWRAKENVANLPFQIIYWVIVYSTALGLGLYQSDIVPFFFAWPDHIAGVIANNTDNTASVANFLDQIFSNYVNTHQRFMDFFSASGSFDKAGWLALILSILVLTTGIAVCSIGGGLLALAHIFIAINLAIGPFLIIWMLLPFTSNFFGSWLTQLITHGMTIVYVALALVILTSVTNNIFASTTSVTELGVFMAGAIIAFGVVCIIVLKQVKDEAARIAGGMAGSLMGLGSATSKSAKNALGAGYDIGSGNALSDHRRKAKWRQESGDWAKANPSLATRAIRRLRG